MAWLSRNNFTGSDYVQASDLNNLANDQRTWGGDVNGGGYTLSNVNIVAAAGAATAVTSVFSRTGDVVAVAGDYTVAQITGAVPSTVQVIAGPGLTGGGALTGNVTLNAAVASVFGRTGAVTLTPNDITGAQGVIQTRAVNTQTGSGLTGGGNLSADLNLSVIPGDPTQQLQFSQGGAVKSTRHYVNFISGQNITIAVTDNTSASPNRVDVTIAASGSGTGMTDPTTTTGDLIVHGSGGTTRLGVGSDNMVLIADSTSASGGLGVRWGTAPSNAPVTSVFGRTGAIVAGNDYTAAQIANAVDQSQTYSDPAWLTTLSWGKIINLPSPAFIQDPTTAKGDLIVRGAAIARLPVGANGTALIADNTQLLGVRWGAAPVTVPGGQYGGDLLVWKQSAGWQILSAAGQPAAVGNVLTVQTTGAAATLAWQAPPPSQPPAFYVNGTLVQSTFNLNVVAGNNTTITGTATSSTMTTITVTTAGPTSGLGDPTTTKGDLLVRGAAQVTRLPVGLDGQVLTASSAAANGLGVVWATGTGGGGSQTPWATNIDAASFSLSNIPVIQAPPGSGLTINAPGAGSAITLQANGITMAMVNDAAGLTVSGSVTASVNVFNNNPPQVVIAGTGSNQWTLTGTSSPTTPGTNVLTFQCVGQTPGIYTMNDLGYLGVGVATPAYAIDTAGDINCSGFYRIAGTRLAAAQVTNAVDDTQAYADPAWITALAWNKITGVPSGVGQTPWVQDIQAAGFRLLNTGNVGIGNSLATLPTADNAIQLVVGPTASGSTIGEVTCVGNTTTAGGIVGGLGFANYAFTGAEKRTGLIFSGIEAATGTNGFLGLYTNNGSGLAECLHIASGGFVSIGTPTAFGSAILTVSVPPGDPGLALVRSTNAAQNSGLMFGTSPGTNDYELYIPANSSDLRFYTGSGGDRVAFTAAGNVGINTDTPHKLLEVFSSAATVVQAIFGNNSGAIATLTYNNVGGLQGYTNTVASAGANITLQPSGQFLGIGTENPQTVVNIVGLKNNTQGMLRLDTTFTAIGDYNAVGWGTVGSPTFAGISCRASGGGQTAFDFICQNGSSQSLAAGANVMSIIGSGQVGINLTSIASGWTFQAYNPAGNIAAGFTCPSGYGSYLELGVQGQTSELVSDASGNFSIGCYGSVGSVFALIRAGAVQNTMYLIGGKVGLGTTNPSAQLHITSTPGIYYVKFESTSPAKTYGIALAGGANPDWLLDDITLGLRRLTVSSASGNFGVGTGSPGYKCDIAGDCNVSGAFRVNGVALPTTSGMTSLALNVGGPQVNSVTQLGFAAGSGMFVTYTNNSSTYTTVSYSAASDIRMKQNVTDLTGGVSIIERLRPVAFEYNGACGKTKGQRSASIIAQELAAILPDAVETVATKLYPEDAEPVDLLTFDPMQITAQLILAVQQLSRRLAALEAKKPD
jgi:hypothetical protein